jgi:DNA polymerase (family 10)
VNAPHPHSGALRQLADLSDIRGDSAESAQLRRTAGALDAGRTPRAEDWKATTAETELALRAARARIPWLLRRLVETNAIQTSEAVGLARSEIVTLVELEVALDSKDFSGHFGASLDKRLRSAHRMLSGERRLLTLARASDVVESLIGVLTTECPLLELVTPAGGIRRYEPLVDTPVVVACAAEPDAATRAIAAARGIEDVLYRTARRVIVVYNQIEIDVSVATPRDLGSVLHGATGPAVHLVAMATRTRHQRRFAREEDLYAEARLSFIPPELRQGTGELEAAAARRLPTLVELEHIRGDLHMHSTYSDGQDSLATMAAAASALGYEYIAITDHSENAGASRTVTLDALERQRDEIARLRERYPTLAILHGIEVDIMPNGRLDFPDEVLATLDIVLASLHEHAGHNARRLTHRCLGAIRHPLVSIISHPGNQIVGRRPAYPLDYDAIYEAAAATGTALEIDGAPAHLDMDGDHARAAVAAGVTVVIDSDCHRAGALGRYMRFGVGTARRGWVERRHVLNTRPIGEVRRFIEAKRSGRR